MLLDKYNKTINEFEYQQVPNPEYKNLKNLYENEDVKQVPLYGLFINSKGYYGDSPIAVSKGYNINLPKHLLEPVKEMIEDREVIELVNTGNVFMEIYPYTNRWGTNYSVKFIANED